MKKESTIIQKLNSFDCVYYNNKLMKQVIINSNDEIEIILENDKTIFFLRNNISKIMSFRNLIVFKVKDKFIVFKIEKEKGAIQ